MFGLQRYLKWAYKQGKIQEAPPPLWRFFCFPNRLWWQYGDSYKQAQREERERILKRLNEDSEKLQKELKVLEILKEVSKKLERGDNIIFADPFFLEERRIKLSEEFARVVKNTPKVHPDLEAIKKVWEIVENSEDSVFKITTVVAFLEVGLKHLKAPFA